MIIIVIKIYSVQNTLCKSIKIPTRLNVTFKQISDSSAANLRKSQPELNPSLRDEMLTSNRLSYATVTFSHAFPK